MKILVKHRPMPVTGEDGKTKEVEEVSVWITYAVSRNEKGEKYECKAVVDDEELPEWLQPTTFDIEVVYPTKDDPTLWVKFTPMGNMEAKLFINTVYSAIYVTEETGEAVR